MATDFRQLLSSRLRKLVPLATELSGPAFARGRRRAQVIAVAASKGGVGKTTTALNLAAGLARFQGARALLVDLDPQGHVATSFYSEPPPGRPAVATLLSEGKAKGRELMEAAYGSAQEGLDLTPSDKNLGTTESFLSTKIGKEFILRGILETTRTHYDFILFDCPPHLGTLTLNALVAADHLLIPSDLTVLSLEGIADILSTVATLSEGLNHSLHVLGILPTRVDRRNRATNGVMEQSLRELYGDYVLRTEIPVSTAVNRAQLSGQLIYDVEASNKVAQGYRDLVVEVSNKVTRSLA